MNSNSGGLIGLLISFGVASAVGFFAMAALMMLGSWTLLQALFAAAVIFAVLGGVLAVVFSQPLTPPVEPGTAGMAYAAPEAPATPAPAPAAAAAAPAPTPEPAATTPDAPAGKPEGLTAARDGGPDDLKLIKGVGPKLEQLLHGMGYFHFDQVAAWTAAEVAWVDENLEGFKGRVTRDNWVEQAKTLAAGD